MWFGTPCILWRPSFHVVKDRVALIHASVDTPVQFGRIPVRKTWMFFLWMKTSTGCIKKIVIKGGDENKLEGHLGVKTTVLLLGEESDGEKSLNAPKVCERRHSEGYWLRLCSLLNGVDCSFGWSFPKWSANKFVLGEPEEAKAHFWEGTAGWSFLGEKASSRQTLSSSRLALSSSCAPFRPSQGAKRHVQLHQVHWGERTNSSPLGSPHLVCTETTSMHVDRTNSLGGISLGETKSSFNWEFHWSGNEVCVTEPLASCARLVKQ